MKPEEISFNLISLAGDAMGKLFEANDASLKGDNERYAALMAEATQLMNEAHNEQTKLLVSEAQGTPVAVNVLLIHAQDTLMNTILAETFTKQLAKTNARIAGLEEKLQQLEKNN
ncbi:PTS lactose/cellobiose transporter subunit IIA [Enterococcus sp. UD-01]|jgi:cellobiose-specific phosphotransferase system component IIA|uniref:PTS lactose/cellobiose transporter subunit IIA n=1 Tax=Enterococcus sp. UD-01 TaxID=3373911 RepID=UPI003836DAF6